MKLPLGCVLLIKIRVRSLTTQYEKTMENREFFKVEENVETIIKIETDTFDDYEWNSTIEIVPDNIVDTYVCDSTIGMSEGVDNQNNVELPFEFQNVTVNSINNFDDILKNHLAEDKKQLNLKTNKCKYCGKKFKLRFGLNRHVQKHHKYNEIQGNIKNTKREEYSNANAKDRNTSNETLNSQSAVSVAPHNSITHNCHVLNIRQEKTTQSSVQMDLVNDNETSYSDINDLNNSSNTRQKKYFYCNICEKKFPSLVKYKNHQTRHDKPQSFSCKYCDRTFSGKGQCTNHEKTHIKCEKNTSTNVRGRKSSGQIHLMNSNRSIIATASNNSVANDLDIQRKKKIQQEEYSNANSKDRITSYEILNSQSAVSVASHHSITHNWPDSNIKEEKYTSSNVIETNNSYQINLPNGNESMFLTVSHNSTENNYHVLNIKQKHKRNKKKSTFCTTCNEDFADICALKNHMNMHMDRKPYVCQYCYQQFSREGPYNLHVKKHMLIKDDQKPMIEFTSNQDSKNFIKSLRFKCNYCEKTYSTLSRRLTHMKKFHIESDTTGSSIITYKKPKKPVQCDICLETFSSSGYLIQHKRIHSGDKPYTCVKCNVAFTFKSNLRAHQKKKIP
ncbi:hypothetical protein AGLY_017170, partial [Aphis glycines]